MEKVIGLYKILFENGKLVETDVKMIQVDKSQLGLDKIRFITEEVDETGAIKNAMVTIYEGEGYISKEEDKKEVSAKTMVHAYAKGLERIQHCDMDEKEEPFFEYVRYWYGDEIKTIEVLGAYYEIERVVCFGDIHRDGNIVTIENGMHQLYHNVIKVEMIINGEKLSMPYKDSWK